MADSKIQMRILNVLVNLVYHMEVSMKGTATGSNAMRLAAKSSFWKGTLCLLCLALSTWLLPADNNKVCAQVAGADQGIFNDEQQMLRINNMQTRQYEMEKNQAEREYQAEQQRTGPYRLYCEKKVQELTKSIATTPSGKKKQEEQSQLGVFQDWLKRDNEYKAKQQAYISQLQAALKRTEKGQQETLANLSSDIGAMRENVQDQKDAQKFNQMMQVNYFNELQSEMGAASWGRPPTDGTYNSVGGYGFMGGYGYGAMGRMNYRGW